MNVIAQWLGPRAASPGGATALLPNALAPGTLLGPLRIERPLARGASAMLYLATDVETQAAVAVKALCPSADGEAAAQRERFLREGERASALQHPHIVRIFGGGQVREVAFLAMQWLPGSDLARWASTERRLPEAAVLEIAAQLADALAYAHRQGVVHRDVKPANVIYDPATRQAVLTDFGLARRPDGEASRSGLLIGSPSYMAPELLAGAVPDARSDLYALGVLCYELLAGRPPFEADRLGALLQAVATQAPPSLTTVRPALADAAALDALLMPLLAKAPAERPFDAQAWAAQARLQVQWLTATRAN